MKYDELDFPSFFKKKLTQYKKQCFKALQNTQY